MDPAPLLAELTPAQRQAVESDAAPLCILAGAGSGKTRVLTRRIAYRIATERADAGHVLALTFTRRAAGELGARLRALGIRDRLSAGTFHALAYAQLRQYWADRGEAPPQLLDRKARLLAPLVVGRRDVEGAALRDLAAEIEWATARLIAPEGYPAAASAAGRQPPAPADAVAALFARYQAEKKRRRLADFDDLLERCAAVLEGDPGFAAVQRWRWRHLFVDEFQDLNPLQYRLLSAWLGDRQDICVVGDPNQAVYGWNGADPSLLTSLPARWPGTEVIYLDDNHRCSPQVVAAAARVLGSADHHPRSSRPDGPPTVVRAFPTDAGEAAGVVSELRQAHAAGRPWSHLAILMRTNAQIGAFEAACRAAQVPYRLAGARPFLDDPIIQSLVTDIGRRRDIPLAAVVADLAELGERSPVSDSHIPDRPAAARVLAGLAADYQRLELRPTVEGFVSWLGPATSRDRLDEGVSGVTISSFHRAKGLEWPAVWVTGLEDGLVPISHARTAESETEERRLLYVALTRAGDELHCSWAEARHFGDHLVARRPSPWLSALTGAAGKAENRETPPGLRRQRLATPREQLARCRRPGPGLRAAQEANADPAVVEALRAWRASAARAAGVPAHVLLHDATLAAVAAGRPATPDDLLGVPGLGPVKVARYGAVLLDLVAGGQRSSERNGAA
ncbi:MAG TPA: ATP-dependent DNA helicase UvrD2 [Acidimicrobiales bacterium]|nr:ATP-dependent DNA helicase UvrD2 [Acidimicrobiales bacterium]